MKLLLAVYFILLISIVKSENNGTFPTGFLFGVDTAAYKTEGAWNEDQKGENIWDHWVHDTESHIKDDETGDVTSDSYHNFDADLILSRYYTEAKFYSFSISWSRILPDGFDGNINLKGILHYQELIDRIIGFKMIPVATLYFNDLPQHLQDIGGWQNPEMIKYFTNYARVVFTYLDKVQYWITFNEPKSTCRFGYGEGLYAPGIAVDGFADYACSYVLLKSHAAVYHLYKDEFSGLEGKISIAIDFNWSEPASQSEADVNAAERRNMFEFGLYANPIYQENWPQVVIDRVAYRSQNENNTKSRLLAFTPEEIDYIKGTSDFLAVNLGYTNLVKDVAEPEFGDPGYLKDMRVEISLDPNWELASNGNPIVPWNARKILTWIKNTYSSPNIIITGNRVSDDGTFQDTVRVNFYSDSLSSILDAMYEDDVKVFAYSATLLDGFEWSEGYSQRYGLFYVNFTDPDRARLIKQSARFYRQLTRTLQIPDGTTTTSTSPTTTSVSTTTDATNRILFYPLLISVATIFSLLLF